MDGHMLNIAGSEWIIIVFIALVLILGTNQLPGAAKRLGRAVSKYDKAKKDVREQIRDATDQNIRVSGPVQNERQKLEAIAESLRIDAAKKSDDELREAIADKMGKKPDEAKAD